MLPVWRRCRDVAWTANTYVRHANENQRLGRLEVDAILSVGRWSAALGWKGMIRHSSVPKLPTYVLIPAR